MMPLRKHGNGVLKDILCENTKSHRFRKKEMLLILAAAGKVG
jgi:hypothetical protein